MTNPWERWKDANDKRQTFDQAEWERQKNKMLLDADAADPTYAAAIREYIEANDAAIQAYVEMHELREQIVPKLGKDQ